MSTQKLGRLCKNRQIVVDRRSVCIVPLRPPSSSLGYTEGINNLRELAQKMLVQNDNFAQNACHKVVKTPALVKFSNSTKASIGLLLVSRE